MSDDDKVKRLPVKFRKPPADDRTLFAPWEVGAPNTCYHRSFIVDETKDKVECATCKEKLNPMWVLKWLANEERSLTENFRRAHEAMDKLKQRSRTKCEWCSKMTRIRGR